MLSGVVRVNNQSNGMMTGLPDSSTSPDPRYMGTFVVHLRGNQHPQHETQHDLHHHHRRCLTTYYACWLAPSGLPRIWRVWYGTLYVETGGGVRTSRSWCLLSADTFSVRKGLVWLLLATIAEVPPVVCVFNFMYSSFPLI